MNFIEDLAPLDHLPVTDLPIDCASDRYEDATEVIIDCWKNLPDNPVAIYQIGQVKAPGISDLDFILIFKDPSRIDYDQYIPTRFPDWIQELFTHPPYFTTLDLWNDLQGWHPTFDMKHLWGEKLPPPQTDPALEKGLALGMLTDYLTVKIPVDVLNYGLSHPVKVRTLLCILNSVKYIIYLAHSAEVPVPDSGENLVDEIHSLRSTWHQNTSEHNLNQLYRLWNEVLGFTGLQLSLLDKYLREVFDLQKDFTLGGPDGVFWFRSPMDFTDRYKAARTHRGPEGFFKWPSPASFSWIFSVYARENRLFSDYFQKNGIPLPACNTDPCIEKGLRYHARIMIENRLANKKMGIPQQKYTSLGALPLSISQRSRRYIQRMFRGDRTLSDAFRQLCKLNHRQGSVS